MPRGRPKGSGGKLTRLSPNDYEPESRELVSSWMHERIQALEAAYEERIQVLRTVGEHPSPLFAELVKRHAYAGLDKRLIAKMLCCTTHILDTFYENEMDVGSGQLIYEAGMNLARMATSPTDPNNAKAAIEVLNRRGGETWKPPAQKIISETTNAPPVIDSSKLSFEERQQLRAMLERIANGDPADEGVLIEGKTEGEDVTDAEVE